MKRETRVPHMESCKCHEPRTKQQQSKGEANAHEKKKGGVCYFM